MKSIKPGRGPSFMGGAASLGMALFGVFWTISAATMGDRFHRFCTHCGKELP